MSPNLSIAHYRIVSKLGEGGMGAVYRASDTKLLRDVAIKVLPPAFAEDAARMQRFEREGQVLASLNHPNIAQIYGIEAGAIVMELVEGATLGGRLPIDTALHYARQIVEALEYAHERGVIHRDLKPANIQVTPEGVVKLLDFGLAKAIEDPFPSSNPADSPTLTLGHTRVGAILGTAAYMAPEQAVGKPADRRSDIFSFGAVFYEMLTGVRAFGGELAGETLAAVVKDEPDWSKLPADTPAAIGTMLRRCLAKDRRQRLQAIGEARIALENPGEAASAPVVVRPERPWVWIGAAAVLAVVAAMSLRIALQPAPAAPPRPTVHFTMSLPLRLPTGNLNAGCCEVTLSPDGTKMAFLGPESGPLQIYLRGMDQLEDKPIPGTEQPARFCFSPDGNWIAFYYGPSGRPVAVKKIPISGGVAQTIAAVTPFRGPGYLSWGADGNLLYNSGEGLNRVSENGGKPQMIAKGLFASAEALPDGEHLLVSDLEQRAENVQKPQLQVAAIHAGTGVKKILIEDGGVASYLPSGPVPGMGHIVYWNSETGSLTAAPFDAKRIELRGPASIVLEGVQPLSTSFGLFGLSDAGILAYVRGGATEYNRTLVWVDHNGTEEVLPVPAAGYTSVRLSPDGGRAALRVRHHQRPTSELRVADLSRGGHIVIATDWINDAPAWTSDGKLIYGSSVRGQSVKISMAPGDGSAPPAELLSDSATLATPESVSRDGKLLIGDGAHNDFPPRDGSGLWTLALPPAAIGNAKIEPFLDTRGTKSGPHLSPDGRWVAYASNESGRFEVYVAPFPGPGAKTPVSNSGARSARWSANGKELFYRGDGPVGAVYSIAVETTPVFRILSPARKLFEGRYMQSYDISSDGRRFLMIKPPPPRTGSDRPEVHVIVNWFEELRRRAPLGK